MSVLRKRSPWIVPTASLLGALTLGLAGCGGGDDTPFAPSMPIRPVLVATPIPVVGQNPRPAVAGQGQTLTGGTIVNPADFGGITNVRVVIPTGGPQENTTLAVEAVPVGSRTVLRPGQVVPNELLGLVALAEIAFGSVDEGTNRINTARPIIFNGDATIEIGLAPGTIPNVPGRLGIFQIIEESGNSLLVPLAGTEATVEQQGDGLVIRVNHTGRFVVVFVPQHLQGTITGG